MGTQPASFQYQLYPVDCVSYENIRGESTLEEWPIPHTVDEGSFMGRLRSRTGCDYDLPTEAQWEYACRSGTVMFYSYGEIEDGTYMWYSGNSSGFMHEVGTRKPNSWGFYDMHGNVREWCFDYPYANRDFNVELYYRITRGGKWDSGSLDCTSFSRNYECGATLEYGTSHCRGVGFRLVMPAQ